MVCTGKGEIKCDSKLSVLDDEENDGGVTSGSAAVQEESQLEGGSLVCIFLNLLMVSIKQPEASG